MTKTVYAYEHPELIPLKSIYWKDDGEFDSPEGNSFTLTVKLYEDGAWVNYVKVVDLECARRLVRLKSTFELVRELLGNPAELTVVFREFDWAKDKLKETKYL